MPSSNLRSANKNNRNALCKQDVTVKMINATQVYTQIIWYRKAANTAAALSKKGML
ncbi:MAG: hypothetical protein RLY17_53 [Pseudomonadota bacterium]|jgi:hypothetical protein